MFYLITLVLLLIDQLSKIWIRTNVAIGESFQLGPIIITHYENSGAAFSSFQGYGRLFVPVAICVVIFLIYYRKREGKRFLLELGAGFLAGGALGNAIDRVLFNQVTDFITFGKSNGILNIADYAINIGVILLIFDTVYTELIKKKPETTSEVEHNNIEIDEDHEKHL